MNKAAEIYLAMHLDKRPTLARIAACILTRYVLEMHRYGEFTVAVNGITKLAKRFRLGDYACALHAHYPPRSIRNFSAQLRIKPN